MGLGGSVGVGVEVGVGVLGDGDGASDAMNWVTGWTGRDNFSVSRMIHGTA